MIQLITDRTNADVNRANEINKKVYSAWASATANYTDSSAVIDPVQIAESTLTDQEFAEWLAGLKGAYNYSDLNRVEAAVAELSELVQMDLITKTDWAVWDVPTKKNMNRYISNLRAVKSRYKVKTEIPNAMDGFTYESANNIEKMLSEACEAMSIPDGWKKYGAIVEYNWVYTRDDTHESVGTTGRDGILAEWVVSSDGSGLTPVLPANPSINFSDDAGFYTKADDYPEYTDYGVGWHIGLGTECRLVTKIERNAQGGSGYYYYDYEVVGYAEKENVPTCKKTSDYYGEYLFPKGELPTGTLIQGSLRQGYCYVQDADGKYYYYELS